MKDYMTLMGKSQGWVLVLDVICAFGIHGNSISQVVFGQEATEAIDRISSYALPITFRHGFLCTSLGHSWEHMNNMQGLGCLRELAEYNNFNDNDSDNGRHVNSRTFHFNV